jgi:hypothetical protein
VIAIIAILAAILFPVFAQAREKARMAVCLSNTKQMGLAIMMYAADYDETLPTHGPSGHCRGRWYHQILPYVKNYDVFTCPHLPENRVAGPPANPCVAGSDRAGYGWNLALGNVASMPPAGYSLAQIAKPAATIIAGDSGLPGGGSGWIIVAYDPRTSVQTSTTFPSTATIGSHAQFRHHMTKSARVTGSAGSTHTLPLEGRCTFVFLDGHSKSLNPDQAFEKAQGTPPMEGGQGLTAADPRGQNYNTEYVLWNIY